MSLYPTPGMTKVTAVLPVPVVDSVDAFGADEQRSRSSVIRVLLAEALDARALAAERSQDATTPGAEGAGTGRPTVEALSAVEPVGGGR